MEDPNFDIIMNDLKNHFDKEYISQHIYNNFAEYGDDEEMEEAGYTDQLEYYKDMVGGNGLEVDLINEMWEYLKEKGIDLTDEKYEDLRYEIEYYIQEHFPNYYFVDYRKKSDYQKLMDSLDKNWI